MAKRVIRAEDKHLILKKLMDGHALISVNAGVLDSGSPDEDLLEAAGYIQKAIDIIEKGY
jgi:hypothetical protein